MAEVVEADGFDEVIVHAGLEAGFTISLHGVGGQGDDGGVAEGGWGWGWGLGFTEAEETGGFVAVDFRHVAIHENEVIGLLLEAVKGFAAIGDGLGLIAEFPKELEGDLTVHEVVLGEEDAGRG